MCSSLKGVALKLHQILAFSFAIGASWLLSSFNGDIGRIPLLPPFVAILWLYRNRIPAVALELESTKILHAEDLRLERGAIISGSTGMGKSTLRFHLIHYFQGQGYSIIDFDLKGENGKYVRTRILNPGRNFGCNLFDLVDSPSELHSLLSGILDDLTPPQNALLEQSIRRTMTYGGNLQNLFCNILIIGHQNAGIGIGSSQTPLALLHRLIFLQNELGSILNIDSTTDFSPRDDLFFNLSYMLTQTHQTAHLSCR